MTANELLLSFCHTSSGVTSELALSIAFDAIGLSGRIAIAIGRHLRASSKRDGWGRAGTNRDVAGKAVNRKGFGEPGTPIRTFKRCIGLLIEALGLSGDRVAPVPGNASGQTEARGVWVAGNVADVTAGVRQSAASGVSAAVAINAAAIPSPLRRPGSTTCESCSSWRVAVTRIRWPLCGLPSRLPGCAARKVRPRSERRPNQI